MKDIFRTVFQEIEKGKILALITVVEVVGSVPQRVGAKMLVSKEGDRITGTIGGGRIEEQAIIQAKQQIQKGERLLKVYDLRETGETATGMLCGGKMTLFFDIVGAHSKVYIFGGGHIAQCLVPLLQSLSFWCIVIDNREDYLYDSFRHIEVSELRVGNLPIIIDSLDFEKDSYIVIVSYSHELDEQILSYLLENKKKEVSRLKYLGMIGSKLKVKEIFSRLESKGINKNLLESVHSPIGLPIGSQTPEEIAISIAAEIIRIRNAKGQ